jgi:hypothetical protein
MKKSNIYKKYVVPKIEGEITVNLAKGVRIVPTFKILEKEKQKDGTTLIKKAELVEMSLVFDK